MLELLVRSVIIRVMINHYLNISDIIGKEIEIISMEGEPQYTGRRGFIKKINSLGQLHGTWGGCAIIPKSDDWKFINSNDDLK